MTSDSEVLVARIVPETVAEGPGQRFALWVQGCTIRCPGCFNPHMWSAVGGKAIEVSDLVRQIESVDVEGVTLLGGEPFEQAPGLAALAREVQAAGRSVMTFSGYTFERLSRLDEGGVVQLMRHTDLLVSGPFIESLIDLDRPWAGSTNQEFHFLSEKYRHLEGTLESLPDRIEVRVGGDGRVGVNGWATADALDMLLEGIGRRERITRD